MASTLIIGLDGVPFPLLEVFFEEGHMPFMASLAQEGVFGAMEVELPPLSSVSWSSFMTAANPGVHGIYGFTDLDREYRLQFYTFVHLRTETVFHRLGKDGLRCRVINLPSTYPALEFPGVLISGFVAVELERSVYPPSLFQPLRDAGYEIDMDLPRAREDRDYLFSALHRELHHRRAALALTEGEWDLSMVVITGTDRLNHFAFSALTDPSHPHHSRVVEYYRSVDRFVEEVVKGHLSRDPDCRCLFLSDHGFGALEQEVYLNRFLEQRGYISYKTSSPSTVADLDPRATRAFVLDPGRVYINRRGRFVHGSVGPAEADRLLDELSRLFLEELEFQGEAVVEKVLRGSDIYMGPEVTRAPDLVLVPRDGMDLKATPAPRHVFGRGGLEGMHHHHHAFYLLWPPTGWNGELHVKRLLDLARLVEKEARHDDTG